MGRAAPAPRPGKLLEAQVGPTTVQQKSALIPLTGEDRLRVRLWRRTGEKVSEFVVQYEALLGGEWCEVARYDNRDEPPHKDLFGPGGKKYKEALPDMEPEQLVIWLVEDLRRNWREHRARYEREPGP